MCHLKYLLLSERDVADADFREALTVTLLLRVVLAALHLEDDDLLVAPVLDDLGSNRCALERRYANERLVAIGAKDDVTERDFRSGFARQTWNSDSFSRLGAVLLAASADDCVGHWSTTGVRIRYSPS